MESTVYIVNNICRICFITASDLSPMSDELKNLYRNLVDEVTFKEFDIRVCTICLWMLHRYAKFKLQCWQANNLLNEAVYEGLKCDFQQRLNVSHCYKQSQIEVSQYIPCKNNNKGNIKHKYTVTNNTRNTEMTIVYTNDSNDHKKDTEYDVHTIENYEYKNNTDSEKVISQIKDNQEYNAEIQNVEYTNDEIVNDDYTNDVKVERTDDSDDNVSDDETPLMFMRNSHDEVFKRNRRSNEMSKSKQMTTTLIEFAIKKEKKEKSERRIKKKHKKDLKKKTDLEKNEESKVTIRNGFSKRMVQETSEYIVIKRTKEQVLEEMSERANTESYLNLRYKCEQCVKGFNFQDVLDKHLEKHSEKNGPLKCDMCGQHCPSAVSLRGHIKSHTTRYKCKVCGCVKASRQHLLEHHASHVGATPTYRCDTCTFTTDKRTVMQRHVRGHSHAPLTCEQCGNTCRSLASLRMHIANHNKSSHYKCPRCPRTFVYYSVLSRHLQCAHETAAHYCVECDVQFSCADSLKTHLKNAKRHRDPVDYKHVCETCGKSFFTSSSLSAHKSSAHDAPRTHRCPHCPNKRYSNRESFLTSSSLSAHKSSAYDAPWTHRCPHCPNKRDTLRSHIWRTHTKGDAPVTCHQCGASFARKSTLKIHLRTHTDERSHVCACGAVFTHANDLQDHMEIKHKGVELQLYENKTEV